MEKVLFIVDMQNDFLLPDGKLTAFKGDPTKSSAFISKVQTFLNQITPDIFNTVVETFDTHHLETYSSTTESDEFPEHCIFGTKGWNTPLTIPHDIPVERLYKQGFDIWNEHNYKFLSKDYQSQQIFLAGIATDYCVKYAMEGFLTRGATVIVLSDLVQELFTPLDTLIADKKYAPYKDKGLLKAVSSTAFLRTPTLT